MIIWIDGDESEFVVPMQAQLVEALIELGEAGYRGRHAVVANRRLLKLFSTLGDLSQRARAYFARIYEEYTQLGHVLAHPKHIVASISSAAPIKHGQSWRVPLHLFAQAEYAQSAEIICENDTDYEVLQAFAESMVKSDMRGCLLSTNSRAGGGGSTTTVLRRIFSNPHPLVLCVLDSDRECVLGAEGSTARGCRAVWVDTWRAELYVLTSRELENVLPLELIKAFVDAAGEESTLIELFSNVDRDLADYVCLKSGEQMCRFHNVEATHLGYVRTRAALISTALRHRRFTGCGADCADCSCDVVPKLGERFLENFARWLAFPSNFRLIPEPLVWSQDLRNAVAMFVAMGLALPRKI